ncbi:dTMP kinase [Kordiimonas aquimaris]|uniref:dTMP kinase n=1 Tax=Kordiimonas aquimaris TaxID=707591 RepID=UPI0021D11A04|nr:dTMP kinase [Kordiimonas aquimaris]
MTPQFISFEGGEGAGKSTQIALLSAWLEQQKVDHIITREPGGSAGAELIRDLLVKGATDRWEPMTEALLMTASRTEHIHRTILPALAAGKWVLCDRFFDSTIAYQGAARGLGMDSMRQLQTLAFGDVAPHITFFLNIPVVEGLMRARGREGDKQLENTREDRFERMDTSFHEALHDGFVRLTEQEPERIKMINASKSISDIQADIRGYFHQILNNADG